MTLISNFKLFVNTVQAVRQGKHVQATLPDYPGESLIHTSRVGPTLCLWPSPLKATRAWLLTIPKAHTTTL